MPSEQLVLEEGECGFVDVNVNVSAAVSGSASGAPSEDPALSSLLPLAPLPSESTPILLSAFRRSVAFSIGFWARPAVSEVLSITCTPTQSVAQGAAAGELRLDVAPAAARLDASSFDSILAASAPGTPAQLTFDLSVVFGPSSYAGPQLNGVVECSVESRLQGTDDTQSAQARRQQSGLAQVYQDV